MVQITGRTVRRVWAPVWAPTVTGPNVVNEGARIVRNLKPILAGLLFCLAAVAPARAQVTIDVSKITCKDLILSTVFEPDHIAYWLNGYYNSNRDNTVLDLTGLQGYVSKMEDYCVRNQDTTVMKAAEILLGASK
jgi:acid stress chaperone HdeB